MFSAPSASCHGGTSTNLIGNPSVRPATASARLPRTTVVPPWAEASTSAAAKSSAMVSRVISNRDRASSSSAAEPSTPQSDGQFSDPLPRSALATLQLLQPRNHRRPQQLIPGHDDPQTTAIGNDPAHTLPEEEPHPI